MFDTPESTAAAQPPAAATAESSEPGQSSGSGDGGRANNDPRNRGAAARDFKIESQQMDVRVSQPLVADTVELQRDNSKRASNDPRARKRAAQSESTDNVDNPNEGFQ